MGLDQNDVLQIVKIIKESKFSELRLEMGDLKLIVRRDGTFSAEEAGVGAAALVAPDASEATAVKDEEAQSGNAESGGVLEHPSGEVGEATEGFSEITASVPGIFYRAPEPGAAPFVEVGTCVTEDDTVGIIEVMKLFYTIKSGVRGKIAKICVDNGQHVEEGTVLVLVEAEA